MYSEPQVMALLTTLTRVYLESHPTDRAVMERFLIWSIAQYGYTESITE